MSMIFLSFPVQTLARKGAVILTRAGISARVGQRPGFLAINGCGIGLWISREDGERAAELLRKNGIAYQRSFLVEGSGAREVLL